jgi:hypothetical protein
MVRDYHRIETSIEPDQLRAVEDLLRDGHTGKGNAITSGAIAEALDEPEGHDTNPNVRDAVRELTHVGVPIASCNRGYYVMDDPGEVDDYVQDLRSRADSIQERAEAVESAAREEGVVQPSLFGRLRAVLF